MHNKTERERRAEREAEREREGQRERWREREAEREKERQREREMEGVRGREGEREAETERERQRERHLEGERSFLFKCLDLIVGLTKILACMRVLSVCTMGLCWWVAESTLEAREFACPPTRLLDKTF